MNATDNLTSDCNPLGFYGPGESPVPTPLLWVALVDYYCVIVFGTLGNALVLWCVATCTKTRRPMKVLLFSVFVPVLVICLGTTPVIAEVWAALLTCDPDRISMTFVSIAAVVFVILGQIEQIVIAAIAVVRAVAVWAPHRPQLGIRGVVVLLVATCIYASLTGVGYIKLTNMTLVYDSQAVIYTTILFFLSPTLPALITTAAYILMMIVIQRNKRRLVASQQQGREATTMDQATRAMLALFISNLVFGLPHSIFHLTGKQPFYIDVMFHVIFCTHFIADPLVYLCFNIGYREKVLSSIRQVMQYLSLACKTQPVIQTGPTASRDQESQQNSTYTQEDSNL